jgi:hypothetical protein
LPLPTLSGLSDTIVNAMCDAAVDSLDVGTLDDAAYIEIHSSTHTVLAMLVCSNPAFGNAGAVNAGEAIANAISDDISADATGTATHFHQYTRDQAEAWTGTVSAAGGGGAMIMDSVVLQSGALVKINSYKVKVPAN